MLTLNKMNDFMIDNRVTVISNSIKSKKKLKLPNLSKLFKLTRNLRKRVSSSFINSIHKSKGESLLEQMKTYKIKQYSMKQVQLGNGVYTIVLDDPYAKARKELYYTDECEVTEEICEDCGEYVSKCICEENECCSECGEHWDYCMCNYCENCEEHIDDCVCNDYEESCYDIYVPF